MVLKRDGRKVEYNPDRIRQALTKCFLSIDGVLSGQDQELIERITEEITAEIDAESSVEEIQDIVETKLMDSNRKDAARVYITYRNTRSKIRESKTEFIKTVKEKLSALNVQNQNANVDERSFGGRKGEADSELMRKIALEYCMSDMAKENHLNNEIYTHDLDNYAVGCHNCLSIPFDKLLANGFNTRQTDVRPARSVNTAMQLIAVIFQLQSLQQFGGVSATHLDHTMVPYVRISLLKHYLTEYVKTTDDFYALDIVNMNSDELEAWTDHHQKEYLDELNLHEEDFFIGSKKLNQKLYQAALFETRKEVCQASEALFHNLNVLGRLNSNIKNIAA